MSINLRAGESLPPKEPTAVSCPIMQAAPVEDQPPKLENSVKTVFAGTFGARTQSGIKMAKNPKTCRKRMMDSNSGRCLAPTVLKTNEKTVTAIVIRVPCQAVGTYCGKEMAAICKMMLPAPKAVVAIAACQPSAESHPTWDVVRYSHWMCVVVSKTDHVAQKALAAWGSKLRGPVVLSSARWGHRRHLSK